MSSCCPSVYLLVCGPWKILNFRTVCIALYLTLFETTLFALLPLSHSFTHSGHHSPNSLDSHCSLSRSLSLPHTHKLELHHTTHTPTCSLAHHTHAYITTFSLSLSLLFSLLSQMKPIQQRGPALNLMRNTNDKENKKTTNAVFLCIYFFGECPSFRKQWPKQWPKLFFAVGDERRASCRSGL